MIELMHQRSLLIPGGFDILQTIDRTFINACVSAANVDGTIDKDVFGIIPDQVLKSDGEHRPFFSAAWRQADLKKWYSKQRGGDPAFEEFNADHLLNSETIVQRHAVAVLSTELEETPLALAAARIAHEIIYIPPSDASQTSDIEQALQDTQDASPCGWKVGALLLREGEIINRGHNGGQQQDSCLTCPKHIDLVRTGSINSASKISPIPCDSPHAEINALNGAQRGDHLLTITSPCLECAEVIIDEGIERVVYLKPHYNSQEPLALLNDNGVQTRQAGYHPTT